MAETQGFPNNGKQQKTPVEVVVDDHLPSDADDLAPGLDAVALLAFAQAAALELARLVDLLQLRRFTQLQAVHVLEVGGGGAPRDRRESARCRLVGVAQR